MKYHIIRIVDERSSDICKAIEEKAIKEGGLEFPFSIGKYTYGLDTLERGLKTEGSYYTHLFHENCRSVIVPVSSNSKFAVPGTDMDDLDRMMLTDGALAENAAMELIASNEVSPEATKGFLRSRFMTKVKNSLRLLVTKAWNSLQNNFKDYY